MALGYNAAGIAGGIGQSLNNLAQMGGNYLMQKDRQEGQRQLQAENPYVRLAANNQIGGAGASYPTAGTPGQGSPGYAAAASAAQDPNRPQGMGLTGQPSDPGGNFNPMTMSREDLLKPGGPMQGLAQRGADMSAWQRDSEPIARTYVETTENYEKAKADMANFQQDFQLKLGALGQEAAQVQTALQGAPGDPELTDKLMALRFQKEQLQQTMQVKQQALQQLESDMMTHGEKLKGLLAPEYAEQRPGRPGYGEEPTSLMSRGGTKDPRLFYKAPGSAAMGPELLSPQKIGDMISPPGRTPSYYQRPDYKTSQPLSAAQTRR